MTKHTYIITETGRITLILNARTYNIHPSHTNYNKILEGLKTGDIDEEVLEELISPAKAIAEFSSDNIQVRDNEVFYKDEPVHNVVTQRILNFIKNGLPATPLINFLEKLLENPSNRSVEELYGFLEHRGLPICEDGDFIAYKVVNSNFYDKHTNSISNAVGEEPSMPRNKVDDNCNNTCSHGLHVGSLEYVKSYGRSGDKVILVKVNPKDAVSVPIDHDAQKLRTSKYKVIAEYEGDVELKEDLYQYDVDIDEDEEDYEVCPNCDEYIIDCCCDSDEYWGYSDFVNPY